MDFSPYKLVWAFFILCIAPIFCGGEQWTVKFNSDEMCHTNISQQPIQVAACYVFFQ